MVATSLGCISLVAAAETGLGPVATTTGPAAPAATESSTAAAPERPIYIREYRITGAHRLPEVEVQEAVYPFLGPGRTERDVEQARAALEKAYYEKGFQTVTVEVPPQQASRGIVILQVVEAKVGRLRVHGSRYFSLAAIKRKAPSIAEGNVPNFNEITRDIVALNKFTDRRVTPTLRPGVEPGTVDIDLNVKNTLPLHGSVELNNRYSANTPQLRLSGSVSYTNLWQLGHTAGASFQVSPDDLEKVKVFTAYYLAQVPGVDWLSVLVQGVKQDSDVSTLGGVAVAGRGETIGGRAIITLPGREGFYHSLTAGMDYKRYDQNVTIGLTTDQTPLYYYPLSLNYSGTWVGKKSLTELNASATMGLRGMGSRETNFDRSRFRADGNYFFFRGDLARTQDLPRGFVVFGKVQGQAAGGPLVSNEQFAGGGLGTARGYLEAEAVGDNGIFGTLEFRSPSFLATTRNVGEGTAASEKPTGNEWRLYAFCDAGTLTLHDPLPDQESSFRLASIGIGSRVQLFDHVNGSIDLAMPLTSLTDTGVHDTRLTFRVWAEF